MAGAAACGSSVGNDSATTAPASGMGSMPGMGTGSATPSGGDDMPGMPMGTGLSATANGYTLAVYSTPMAGMDMPITLTISHDGKPVTRFTPEQTKLMHLYLIRSDLVGFQHLHPTLAPDGTGTWTVPSVTATPGTYRLFTQFIPAGLTDPLVLSVPVPVRGPGAAHTTPLPAPATTTTAAGYTLTIAGHATAGTASRLTITVRRAGAPVTNLQPYLETYAHVTAFRAGNLAFAHLHPENPVHGDNGGPTLTLQAELPQAGTYRMFIQFQTGGVLHTAPITLSTS
jgi:hypothetical protein